MHFKHWPNKRKRLLVITPGIKVWGLRFLVFVGIALLCLLADSVFPAIAFALAWIPNYPLFVAVMIGAIRLPRFLEPVHPIEPMLYRWVGVELIKWLVTTPTWLMLVGPELPPKPTSRQELLDHLELFTKGAETCHGAAFVFASSMALFCLAIGGISIAAWILVST